jgi:hypothetical protein
MHNLKLEILGCDRHPHRISNNFPFWLPCPALDLTWSKINENISALKIPNLTAALF